MRAEVVHVDPAVWQTLGGAALAVVVGYLSFVLQQGGRRRRRRHRLSEDLELLRGVREQHLGPEYEERLLARIEPLLAEQVPPAEVLDRKRARRLDLLQITGTVGVGVLVFVGVTAVFQPDFAGSWVLYLVLGMACGGVGGYLTNRSDAVRRSPDHRRPT